MKGRPRKTAAERALQGNAGRRKPAEMPPPGKVFSSSVASGPWLPAAWLGARAKAIWAAEIDVACRQARMQQSQLPLFAAYCDALARLEQFTAALAKRATYKTKSGYFRARPEVAMRDRAAADVKQLAAELMLSPKSWASGMGTYTGRQLDQSRDKEAAPADRPAPQQPDSDSVKQYLADRPRLH